MKGGLLFFFARQPDQRQLPSVALQRARQTLTQPRRVARIGLHPAVLFTRTYAQRRLGQQMIILRHRHIQPRMHVQTNLDLRPTVFTLVAAAWSEAAPS